MIVIGITGNGINIALFLRKNMRKHLLFKILLTLTITDLIILIFCGSESYLNLTYNIDIRNYSTYTCKFETFFVYFLTQIRNFLTMSLTIFRAKIVSSINNKSISHLIPTNSSIANINAIKLEKPDINDQTKSRNLLEIRYEPSPHLSTDTGIKFSPSEIEIITTSTPNESTKISKQIFENLKLIFNFYKKLDLNGNLKKLFYSVVFGLFVINFHFILLLDIVPKTKRSENNEIAFLKNNPNKSYLNLDSLKKLRKNATLRYECAPIKNSFYEYFLHNIYFWIDAFIYFCVPFASMSISFLLIRAILRKMNEIYLEFIKNPNYFSNSRIFKTKIKKNKRTIKILMFINLYFLLSVLPFFLYNVLVFRFNSEFKVLFKIFVDMLFYSNNAFNVFFYGISSVRYKKEFLRMFKL